MATPPPFPSTSIPPPSVAKLLDDRKLHLLNGRILDNQNNSGGGVVSGFGSSPNYKAQPTEMSQSTLEDNFPPGSSKVQTALFSSSDFGLPEEKTPTPLPTESSDSRSKSHASRGELKLSGEKRPLPADTDDHSVITLESTPRDEEASRERKIRDRKSPKQAKTNPLIVEDIDLVQSNPGENGSRGAVPLAPPPGQRSIVSYFHTNHNSAGSDGNNAAQGISPATTAPNVVSTSNTSTSAPTATAASTTKAGHHRKEKATAAAVAESSGASAAAVAANGTSFDIKKQQEQLRQLTAAKELAEGKALRLEADYRHVSEKLKINEDRNARLVKALEDIHRKMALQEFRRKRDQLALDCVRLGKITLMRVSPTTMSDVWEEGYAPKEISRRQAELLARKEELEARRKKIQSTKRSVAKKGPNAAVAAAAAGEDASAMDLGDNLDVDVDLATETEVLRTHLEQLKRDESALAEERRMLESEKAVHIKELKRCQCEERSRFFRDLSTLNDRYLLQTMLGRGGFSEVWKALDLVDLREVAVKIHQLNPQWSEERKASYIKHVTREYTIHREMRHPRVVNLFDVFEIDVNSFATVLEYCRGIDLDEKLKRQKTIPEKDAKAIFMQILSGLRYLHHPHSYNAAGLYHGNGSGGLDGEMDGGSAAVASSSGSSNNPVLAAANANNNHNSSGTHNNSSNNNNNSSGERGNFSVPKKMSIIHFDLKPANILFDEMGDVKITDFGLSKMIDESNEGTSMDLTSQGAGTYWYLPPECFEKGPTPPRISSKVDVWSVGVIFYQMLYGSRPFGEGRTQEVVWTENLIFNATQVEFPTDPKAPKVSEEAKDLIRVCLTRDQRHRPDIMGVCQHPYIRGGK